MPTAGPRPALSSFPSPIRTKPPSVERKLGCTLEELCRCCKKEVNFTRDIVTNNGYTVCSAILFLFVDELLCVQYEVEIGKMLIFTGRKLFITASP